MAGQVFHGLAKEVHPMRSRSFGGCASCRKRRLKCDESRPICTACKVGSLDCTYEKNLFFTSGEDLDHGQPRYRRPVLSERERQLMSEGLTASIAPNATLKQIARIEEYCEVADPFEEVQISHGPFGAFRVGGCGNPCLENCTPHPWNNSKSAQIENIDREALALATLDIPITYDIQATMNHTFDQSGVYVSNVASEPWLDYFTSGRIHEVVDETPFPSSAQADFHISQGIFSSLPNHPDTPLETATLQHARSDTTQEAVPLLKHYQSTVLPLLTPFRHSKTPWHVLFVPQVKTCLAALTLGEDVDDATLCTFYATLSISALSLGGLSGSNRWIELSRAYRKLARRSIKAVLASAYDFPKKAKYKSILIAILSMVQLSITAGNADQVDTYLIAAESFIRCRGLQRIKSRKVRLLHHCYAFERILFESTRTTGLAGDQAYQTASGDSTVSSYAATFRLTHWTNLEHDMLRKKTPEEGENDLHLQLPGEWSATLYPEIFGVPEQWILLVSLIIQLAKEKESDNRCYTRLELSMNAFLDKAKAIENMINRLQRPTADPELNNLLEAMQHALAIYFYRRIYDVDASMLQQKVLNVRECLLRADSNNSTAPYGAARFIWPAFIAAREAEAPADRLCFSNWFRESAQRSGLQLFASTLKSIEAIWEARMSDFTVCSMPMSVVNEGPNLRSDC